jgi:predicted nucleic acid-binding protein
MKVTIELPPEIEHSLVAQAEAQGLSLPQYLERFLQDQVPTRAAATLSPAERATAWRESVKDLPRTPPLSDEAISRESIYGDRG